MKYRSLTFKHGETEDHKMAVDEVYWFLENHKLDYRWFINVNCPVEYPPEIVAQLPKNRTYEGHIFDVGIFKVVGQHDKHYPYSKHIPIAFIEINGNVGYDYRDGVDRVKHANPTKHSLKKQQQNDKINKNYCELKGIIYKTLLKEEINGDISDKDRKKNSLVYLTRELFEFIK